MSNEDLAATLERTVIGSFELAGSSSGWRHTTDYQVASSSWLHSSSRLVCRLLRIEPAHHGGYICQGNTRRFAISKQRHRRHEVRSIPFASPSHPHNLRTRLIPESRKTVPCICDKWAINPASIDYSSGCLRFWPSQTCCVTRLALHVVSSGKAPRSLSQTRSSRAIDWFGLVVAGGARLMSLSASLRAIIVRCERPLAW